MHLIVLPSCPALSPALPVETWEIWQLPCQNPGAPPTVLPWCIHLNNPGRGERRVVWLSLVVIITGLSSEHSQIILLAFTYTPEVWNLPSLFLRYQQQQFLILFAKACLWAQVQLVPASSGLSFLLSLSNSSAPLFSLKFILLDIKDQNQMEFWELTMSVCPFLSFCWILTWNSMCVCLWTLTNGMSF